MSREITPDQGVSLDLIRNIVRADGKLRFECRRCGYSREVSELELEAFVLTHPQTTARTLILTFCTHGCVRAH